MAQEKQTYVYIQLDGVFVPAGRLTVVEDGRGGYARFRYGARYLERPLCLPIDPITLPLAGAATTEFRTAEGFILFGAIRDAAPDAWGRQVLDRAAQGMPLGEFEYLTVCGTDRIGALGFGADLKGPRRSTLFGEDDAPIDQDLDLEAMMQAAAQVESEAELEPRFRAFIVRGSSLGGARPKGVTRWRGRPSIAKFSRTDDRGSVCRWEHATMLLARQCGIHTPAVDRVSVAGRDVYLIERFDRGADEARRHFISALTLLGAHESESTRKSYADIAAALRQYGADFTADARELFRRMVFNILCNNTDDHLRNHGFLWEGGGWRLSPAYDLVPHPQQGLTRMLALGVGADGREASLRNALSRCAAFGLHEDEAKAIVRDMAGRCRGWEEHYRSSGVPATDLPRLATCFIAAQGSDVRADKEAQESD